MKSKEYKPVAGKNIEYAIAHALHFHSSVTQKDNEFV